MIATKGLKNNTMAKKCLQKRLQNSPNNTKQAQIPQNIDTRKTKQTTQAGIIQTNKQTNSQKSKQYTQTHHYRADTLRWPTSTQGATQTGLNRKKPQNINPVGWQNKIKYIYIYTDKFTVTNTNEQT